MLISLIVQSFSLYIADLLQREGGCQIRSKEIPVEMMM